VSLKRGGDNISCSEDQNLTQRKQVIYNNGNQLNDKGRLRSTPYYLGDWSS